jgi:hypothetical protein
MAVTLLKTVNDILLLLNEQAVESVSESDVSEKVRLALEQAVRDVATFNNQWTWLQAEITGSWSSNVVTLDTSVLDVLRVRYETQPVPWVSEEEFNLSSLASGSQPRCYTRIGNTYYFNPYPTTTEEQDKVKFRVVRYPSFPSADDSTFSVPDEFVPLFKYTALAELAQVHLSDAKAAGFYRQRQKDMLQLLKTKRLSAEIQSQDMFPLW